MKVSSFFSSLTLGVLAGLVNAAPSPSPNNTHRPNGSCYSLTLPLPIKAKANIYDLPPVGNTIDATDLIWDLERWTAPNISDRIVGEKVVDEVFEIDVLLCIPHKGGDILQIATHGFGFDKTYWDPALNREKYSYITSSLAAGYSILTYDRLGVGKSSKPNAYDTVQGAVQVEILKEITTLAQDGKLANFIPKDTTGIKNDFTIPAFEKVILVGHSLGSALTLGTLQSYPSLADAAILTGAILHGRFGRTGMSSFGLEHAATSDPERFSDRGNGYLVQGSTSSVQQIFFKKGDFRKEVLEYASGIKETGTVGEFVSLGELLATPVPGYKGPVLFALAEYDFAVCQGDCPGSYDLDLIKNESFPAASDVQVYILPGSGHALTMHENAREGYEALFGYFKGWGL